MLYKYLHSSAENMKASKKSTQKKNAQVVSFIEKFPVQTWQIANTLSRAVGHCCPQPWARSKRFCSYGSANPHLHCILTVPRERKQAVYICVSPPSSSAWTGRGREEVVNYMMEYHRSRSQRDRSIFRAVCRWRNRAMCRVLCNTSLGRLESCQKKRQRRSCKFL